MIDQNRDGFIDRDDLHDMLASLGKGFYSTRINEFELTMNSRSN